MKKSTTNFNDLEGLIDQLRSKYIGKGLELAWKAEEENWKIIINSLFQKSGIGFNYKIEQVLGIGGAGAVFRVIDKNLFDDLEEPSLTSVEEKLRRSYRALKVPRPHIEKGPSLAVSLREEISRLTSLVHPNIVNLYAKGRVLIELNGAQTSWPWFVMSYIHKAKDLEEIFNDNTCRPSLPVLVRYLYDVAKGMQYIHHNNVIHCDIKPANIFVTSEMKNNHFANAVLADFGYSKSTLLQNGETTVGFTDGFAHPELSFGASPTSQESRTFNKLERNKVRPAFDLFAFGMTINYLLDRFYKSFSVYQNHGYEIKYLKLMSARLLDGLNHNKSVTYANLPYYCFGDLGNIQDDNYIPGIKYRSADELVDDCEKLIGQNNLIGSIPELIESRRENIQVSDVAPVIYSDRVRKVVDHPLLRRLASVSQLGIVSLVYPGATHSRLEHVLGTMGVISKYIISLYNDTLDPLFRQVMDEKSIKSTLLAALFHDIGQYPLAHDLEDVSKDFFGHENFGKRLLSVENETLQKELFPNTGQDLLSLTKELHEIILEYWGVTKDDIFAIFDAKNTEDKRKAQKGSHVARLCKSLIDGPIDGDKVDYLRRDSRHCNIQYGFGIDTGRLFRCLTIAQNNIKDGHLLLTLGVHEKGRIAAESILFARYAMLTQVYWHHTMRSIKALIHHAATEILSNVNGKAYTTLQDNFFRFVFLDKFPANEQWLEKVKTCKAVSSIHAGDLKVLGWLWRNGTESSKSAIQHILNRNLFKRVLIINRIDLEEKQRVVLEKIFKPESFRHRKLLRESIEKSLFVALYETKTPNSLLETQGFSIDEWNSRKESNILRCLIDYPTVRAGSSFGLQVVRQWGDRPNREMPTTLLPNESYPMIMPIDNFRDGMKELEKSIACFRVFWRPEEATILKEVLGDQRIRAIVGGELSKYTVD